MPYLTKGFAKSRYTSYKFHLSNSYSLRHPAGSALAVLRLVSEIIYHPINQKRRIKDRFHIKQ
ncbi:hypothetical protein H6G97_43755 [Nostoc flagelliforme FACHB-838]|uniref:Uncharacterized protein n=1 Tax=Nostoc flagelliforme FACHB-838 TaxID=2692904 RepID=A0ABR8E2G8_9NOSO|nr:hypothetical protein [Nostoc flagelliforme]MBD2535884.1 hypothetical protein [Nostoc flagelliforme FACHB-838]